MASKNNPDARKQSSKGKMVTTFECENCATKCSNGVAYLKKFAIAKEGKGVFCSK